ncbi:D-glycero-alpha-D-manno-heptose-1,7-bisphosphate 7-phosphatase [Candidatus Neomarinimicrobiota bacterium]
MNKYRLLLFDRDGTLTYENIDFHKDLSILPSYPYSAKTLQILDKAGFSIAIVTNQSGIARGFWSMDQVQKLHQRLTKEWQVPLQFYVCPHHPDDDCSCRKPRTSLLEKAMMDYGSAPSQCLMIGDSLIDFKSASAAGIDFALVLTGRGRITGEHLPESPTLKSNTIAQLGLQLV